MGIVGRIMGTKKGGKKRFWSDEEKRSICLQTRAPDVSVAQVARRYAMNANLIHTWLRDSRFSPADEPGETVDAGASDVGFFPVEIEGADFAPGPPLPSQSSPPAGPLMAQRVDIALSDGRRILVEGPTALAAVIAMVEGLST